MSKKLISILTAAGMLLSGLPAGELRAEIPAQISEFGLAGTEVQPQKQALDEDLADLEQKDNVRPAATTLDFLADNPALSPAATTTASFEPFKEVYDKKGRRIEKIEYNEAGQEVRHWYFAHIPVSYQGFLWWRKPSKETKERLIKFRENTYENGDLAATRIAVYAYDRDGGYLKVNKIYDAQGDLVNTFVECVSKTGIKYSEEWFDPANRVLAVKKWDPATGEFRSHFVNVYEGKKLDHRTWLNEQKQVIKREFFNERGRLIEEITYDPETGEVLERTVIEYHQGWLPLRKWTLLCRSGCSETAYVYVLGWWARKAFKHPWQWRDDHLRSWERITTTYFRFVTALSWLFWR